MKDYSLNLEEKKKFILGYKVKNGLMKIKYALGFEDEVPYNEENEKKVLDKMREQVEKIDSNKFFNSNKINMWFDFVIGGICTVGSILLLCGPIRGGMEIGANILGFVFGVAGIVLIPSGFVVAEKINDYKKNKRFIEIEDDLNGKVRNNENMLVNTSSKTKEIVKSTPADKPVFTINSFNDISDRDLEQIMDNTSRDEYFGYNYNVDVSLENSKPKTKKKKL